LAFVILIGGKGTRFGSDKGLFQLDGKALISYQFETLKSFNKDIFLAANSIKQVSQYMNKVDISPIKAFIVDDVDILKDKSERTPLLGLYSAFKELKILGYEKAFILSCDNPFINESVINYLLIRSSEYDITIPIWDSGYVEPLFAIYSVIEVFEKIKENLCNFRYKLSMIIDSRFTTHYVSIEREIKMLDPDLKSFINLNTIGDLKQLKKKITKNF
jgi:molybdopterin-guanine dinucleotide biosynthesis protein A